VEYDETPEVIGAEIVFSHFYQVGMALVSGGDLSPLTWLELEAYNAATKANLSVYMKQLVMKMSRIHVSGLNKFRNPKAKPPYVSESNPLAKRQKR
jgi:hypothetical protein